MAVLAVQAETPLCKLPSNPRQSALNCTDRKGSCLGIGGCEIGQVKADQFGRGGQGVRPPHPAPTCIVRPVRLVGFVGVLGGSIAGIRARAFYQPVQRPRTRYVAWNVNGSIRHDVSRAIDVLREPF